MFKRLKQKLDRNDFLKNIMVLLSGSSLALLIPFIITPILTRFFTPEDFGLWGTYSAIVAFGLFNDCWNFIFYHFNLCALFG